DRREQKQVLLQERKASRKQHLQQEQQQAWHERDEEEKREEDRRLAENVFGPHQRLRQVNLQGVRAAIVGDEPRSNVDRHDEDEEILLLQELPEGFGRRGEHRHLGII